MKRDREGAGLAVRPRARQASRTSSGQPDDHRHRADAQGQEQAGPAPGGHRLDAVDGPVDDGVDHVGGAGGQGRQPCEQHQGDVIPTKTGAFPPR